MEEDGSKTQVWYKLKIPNLGGGVAEDELEEGEIREEPDMSSKDLDSNPNKDNIRIRVCPECSKEFTSGKALGGHMRIHSIPHKKSNQNNKMIKTVKVFKNINKKEREPDYTRKCTDKNGSPYCVLCGKNFPSFKSLFGHMRCHPEREWRGIIPPDDRDHQSSLLLNFHNNDDQKSFSPSVSSSSLSSTDDSEDGAGNGGGGGGGDNSKTDLPKWAVRAKRGQKVEFSGSSAEEEEEEVQLLDAVQDLMMLAKGDDQADDHESSLTVKKQRTDEDEATNSNSLTIKDDCGLQNTKFDVKSEKKVAIETSDNDELSDNNELLLTTMNSNCVSVSPNKRKRKTKMMTDLEPGPTSPDKYKCSTCDKSFPTHQALGGHRSSHNKFKVTIMNEAGDKEEDQNGDIGGKLNNVKFDENAKESGGVGSGSTTNTHQCTICKQVFPTGQALGGHKRCHWTGPPAADQAEQPSSQATSSPGEASQVAAATEETRRVLEFDLNEEPPTEEEGGGDNGNNGYASSSYNSNIG